MNAKKALSTLATLSADGAIAPLVPLLDLVGRLGEAQHLPAKVATRLLLTKLCERPEITLYRPGPAGDYCRRVTNADEFGVDALVPPRFEVLHRYADRTERREIATGRVSTVAHVDVLRSAGKLPPPAKASPSVRVSTEWLDEFHPAKPQPSLSELEARPTLRGRAGALVQMQRQLRINKELLVEVRQIELLLAPPQAADDVGQGKWTTCTAMAKERQGLEDDATVRDPTQTMANRHRCSGALIRKYVALGKKLPEWPDERCIALEKERKDLRAEGVKATTKKLAETHKANEELIAMCLAKGKKLLRDTMAPTAPPKAVRKAASWADPVSRAKTKS